MTTDRTSDAEPLALKSNEGLGVWRAKARTFVRQILCRHKRGTLAFIGWDGEAVYVCERCDKLVRKPL